jgi:hypothetical protein
MSILYTVGHVLFFFFFFVSSFINQFCILSPLSNPLFEHSGGKLVLSIIFILFSLNWNRKLSLNYLQLYASGVKSYKDGGSRRRNSKKHGSDMSYDNIDSMSDAPLSKNDINTIRRSQVWAYCINSLIYDLYLPDF